MEDPWGSHKGEMERLFLNENKTLDEVIKFMQKKYNFRKRYQSLMLPY